MPAKVRGKSMTVLQELDNLIKLMEAQIPANPESPANVRRQKELQGKLADYFNKLEKAFPYSKLEALYNKYAEKEQDNGNS